MDDNTTNIIAMPTPKHVLVERLRAAHERSVKGRKEWIEGRADEAMTLAEARDQYPLGGPGNTAFGLWLVHNELDHWGADDRAAMIQLGRLKRDDLLFVLDKVADDRWRPNTIWQMIQQKRWEYVLRRFDEVSSSNDSNMNSASTSIPEPAVSVPVAAPKPISASAEKPVAMADSIPVSAGRGPASPPARYPVPEKSKLREMIGSETADILLSRFKSGKWIFTSQVKKVHNDTRALFNYLAKRCQQPDYPPELFLVSTWSNQLLYPLLPKRLLDALPGFGSALYKVHTIIVETERRFALTPEFGVTDPPLVAYNKALAIYTALTNAKAGKIVDPAAVHRPAFGDDEGKPPVIVRGTKLWPAETGAGYRHDDLRCACGMANDIISAFDEQRPSIGSKTLKLRHLRSWLSGGYNSTGATPEGTLKAFDAVIQAWTWNVSDEMQTPPSMIKNDGDAR